MRRLSVVVLIVLAAASCARHKGTDDGRLIPVASLGEALPTGLAVVGQNEPSPDCLALYYCRLSGDALGFDGKSVLYPEYRPDGKGAYRHFLADSYLRFFDNGRVIWRFIPGQEDNGYGGQIPDGDMFDAGYVGRYCVVGGHLSAEFYVFTLGGTCFALFEGDMNADGSLSLRGYRTRKHGVLSVNNHKAVIGPLQFEKVAVRKFKRMADW